VRCPNANYTNLNTTHEAKYVSMALRSIVCRPNVRS
jgi:hypothetical protein